jgi:flagellar motor component MotA
MKINSLLELACAKISSLMKGKSAQEIRAIFNIEINLTDDELKEYEDYQI